MGRANIPVHNLYCINCIENIKKELSKIKNISNIQVYVPDSLVMFNFIRANDLSTAENHLTFLGFPPKGDRIEEISKTTCLCKKDRNKSMLSMSGIYFC